MAVVPALVPGAAVRCGTQEDRAGPLPAGALQWPARTEGCRRRGPDALASRDSGINRQPAHDPGRSWPRRPSQHLRPAAAATGRALTRSGASRVSALTVTAGLPRGQLADAADGDVAVEHLRSLGLQLEPALRERHLGAVHLPPQTRQQHVRRAIDDVDAG